MEMRGSSGETGSSGVRRHVSEETGLSGMTLKNGGSSKSGICRRRPKGITATQTMNSGKGRTVGNDNEQKVLFVFILDEKQGRVREGMT